MWVYNMASIKKQPAKRDYQLEAQLRTAIQQRKVVRFRYEFDLHYRVFAPYVLYKSRESRVLIGGNRIADEGDLTKKPALRKYEVGLITSLEVTDGTFKVDNRFVTNKHGSSSEIMYAVDSHDSKVYQT